MLYPSYLNLYETGELAERAAAAWEILRSCTICPQNCRCNRIAGKTGVCRSGTEAIVASWNVHRREEPPISGTRGAGSIFFGYCQARCTYCQNFSLSQGGLGHRVGPERLANMMLYLQKKQCHNLDLVTPTHFVPQILAALVVACDKGLRLPIVYNCAGASLRRIQSNHLARNAPAGWSTATRRRWNRTTWAPYSPPCDARGYFRNSRGTALDRRRVGA